MRFFGQERKQDYLQMMLWLEIVCFFILLCLQMTQEGWIMFTLSIKQNAVLFAEVLILGIWTALLIFAAFLSELAFNGLQDLKLSSPAALCNGLFLFLVSPYTDLLKSGTQGLLTSVGSIAVSVGFILLTLRDRKRLISLIPLILSLILGFAGLDFAAGLVSAGSILVALWLSRMQFNQKNTEDGTNESKLNLSYEIIALIVSAVLSSLLCLFPALTQYGLYLPIIICVCYLTYLNWQREILLERKIIEQKLNREKIEEEEEEEKNSSAETDPIEGQPEDETKISDDLTETKGTDKAGTDKAGTEKTDSETIALSEETDEIMRMEGLSEPEPSKGTVTDSEKEKEHNSVGHLILNALPEDETWIYLINKDEKKAWRYQPQKDELIECGENTEPALRELVPSEKTEEFHEFLVQEGTRQIEMPLWNKQKSCFRNALIMATPLEGNQNADLLLCYDVTQSNTSRDKAEQRLKEEIAGLKQQIALREDEAHRVFLSTNEMLYDIIEKKSNESKQHLRHVSRYAEIILNEMMKLYPELHYTEKDIAEICEASILHDIGKIEIPDAILNKHEQLTPEEFEIMKMHTVYGAQLINKMPYVRKYEAVMRYAAELALHHHERVDGKGYPDGLKGKQLLPYVEAVALADVYEALTTKRSYRESISHEEACRMIESGACGKFSDQMLNVLKAADKEIQNAHYSIETRL